MGCCETSPLASAEALLCEAEKRLNFSEISSIDFDRLLYRFNTNYKITLAQLSEICSICKIDLSNCFTRGFFNEFFDVNSRLYEVRSLSTLGVLLGKGAIDEKLKVMFQNYGENHNLRLCYNEAKQLMNDICSIVLSYIPNYATRCFNDTERVVLNEYKIKLGFMRTAILNHYTSILFENYNKETDEISIDEFVRILKLRKLFYVLNPSSFRRNVMKVLGVISKAAEAANIILDKDNKESSEMYQSLISINSSHEFRSHSMHNSSSNSTRNHGNNRLEDLPK